MAERAGVRALSLAAGVSLLVRIVAGGAGECYEQGFDEGYVRPVALERTRRFE